MPKIKELLANEEEIWVDLNEENYRAFFKQAKAEGFVWINRREIQPDKELFRFCIAVLKEGKIGCVNGYARFGDGAKPKIYTFSIIN